MIPIQIDSKSRVCKFSKHLKILKMRSLEGCETKFMQNFVFFKPFFKGFWPIIWAINPLCHFIYGYYTGYSAAYIIYTHGI